MLLITLKLHKSQVLKWLLKNLCTFTPKCVVAISSILQERAFPLDTLWVHIAVIPKEGKHLTVCKVLFNTTFEHRPKNLYQNPIDWTYECIWLGRLALFKSNSGSYRVGKHKCRRILLYSSPTSAVRANKAFFPYFFFTQWHTTRMSIMAAFFCFNHLTTGHFLLFCPG